MPPRGSAGDTGFAVGARGASLKVCPRAKHSYLDPVNLPANMALWWCGGFLFSTQ